MQHHQLLQKPKRILHLRLKNQSEKQPKPFYRFNRKIPNKGKILKRKSETTVPLGWCWGRTALEAISGSWVWPKTPPMLENSDEKNSWRRLVRVSPSAFMVATLSLSLLLAKCICKFFSPFLVWSFVWSVESDNGSVKIAFEGRNASSNGQIFCVKILTVGWLNDLTANLALSFVIF